MGSGTYEPAEKLEIVGGDAIINGLRVGKGGGYQEHNTAIGSKSLYSNTTGFGNAAFGQEAMADNTTGFYNTAMGLAALSVGYEFSGIDAPENEDGFYGLRYAEFVVPLVKAVQEQQAMIDKLQQENEELRKRMEKIESSMMQ